MTLQSTPAYARVLSHPEITDRNMLRGAFGGRTGAIRPGQFAVTPNATTRKIDVSAGQAFILGLENATQGGYVAWNDAAETLTLAAPAASPVIDSLILRVWDEQYGTLSSGTSRAEWAIVRGTPNASPVAVADSTFISAGANYVPGGWWRVADIRTNPGDTTVPSNQIYPTNTYARQGGFTWGYDVASTTGFGGFPSDAQAGDTFYALNNKFLYRYDGTAWKFGEAYRANTLLGSSAANVSLTIPAGAKRMRILYQARSDTAAAVSNVLLKINNDGGVNYFSNFYVLQNTTSTPTNNGGTANVIVGISNAATTGAAQWGYGTIDIGNLGSSSITPSGTYTSYNWAVSASSYFFAGGFMWLGTGPATSIQLAPAAGNWIAGSRFEVEAWD